MNDQRGDVHYVITEHWMAYLHGKIWQRVAALITIADAKFQGELEEHARKSRLLTGSRSVVAV
jgi:acyl-CoA hydrolase